MRQQDPIKVYARWVGYGGHDVRARAAQLNVQHVYSAAILPEAPLTIGSRIRLLATTPAWYSAPQEDQDTYDAYDAHIVGRISGVAGWKGRKVIFEVVNECANNPVRTVRLRMPYAPDAMVHLDPEKVPTGRREAQEADLYTAAVVRLRPDAPRCDAEACSLPWRRLVGDGFLWEQMEEDVGERHPGDPGGRRKIPRRLVGWEDRAALEMER